MDVACGDTLLIFDPTPQHVVGVVPSLNSIITHLAFKSRSHSFFFAFLALWAAPKPVTELAVKTDLIQECNMCSPVPRPLSPHITDVSTITTPPFTEVAVSITDSVEHLDSAELLREANKIECVEEQINERSGQLERQQENVMPTKQPRSTICFLK